MILPKKLHLTKSELIRRSIAEYALLMEKKTMKAQMKSASLRVRESNKEIADYFDEALEDGLKDV